MSRRGSWMAVLLAGVFCWAVAGCNNDNSKESENGSAENHDDHHHHHDGPHGGLVFDWEPADFKGEWNHDDDNSIVRIFILEPEGKTSAAVDASSVTVRSDKGREPQEFTLEAEDPNEEGKATTFAKKSGPLLVAMSLGVDVEFEANGKTYTATIEPHEHHEH